MPSTGKSLILIVFLFFCLLGSLFLVFRTTVFFGRAATTSQPPDSALQNSYLFASPLQAKADNREKIRITVFLLDGRGLGVANLPIELLRSQTLAVTAIQSVTDDTGQAVFDLSSAAAGKFEISARVGTKDIPQKIKVVFY